MLRVICLQSREQHGSSYAWWHGNATEALACSCALAKRAGPLSAAGPFAAFVAGFFSFFDFRLSAAISGVGASVADGATLAAGAGAWTGLLKTSLPNVRPASNTS